MLIIGKMLFEFCLVFILVYLIYRVFVIKKIKKYNRKKLPLNVLYLIARYKLDVVKIGYVKVVKSLALCDSIIVALLFSITCVIDNIYIRLLVVFILTFPVFAGIYYIVAMHLRKEID